MRLESTAQRPRFTLLPELYRIGEAVAEAGGRPVLVGGWVRDSLLGMPHPKDFDVEVFGLEPGPMRKRLRRFGPVHMVGRHFGVLKLTTQEAEYDVSLPRRESKTGRGHKGFAVEPDATMTFEQAAARRDFTINAMGYAFLEDAFLDPFGGEADLRRSLLRHVGPAFAEDPLRVLRAIQFAGRFELEIVPATLDLCRNLDLSELPRERLWEEFRKLFLRARYPSHGLRYAEPLGVLPYFPELAWLYHEGAAPHGPGPLWRETLEVLDRAAALRSGDEADDMVLMLAALCQRLGAPGSPEQAAAAGALLQRLTNETELLKRVLALVADAHTPDALYRQRSQPPDADLRRLALRVSIPFLLTLALANHRAAHPPGANGEAYAAGDWLEVRAKALGVWQGPLPAVLRGRDLRALGWRPGPAMGQALKAVYEQQLDGHVTTREDALRWLQEQHPELAEAGADDAPEAP